MSGMVIKLHGVKEALRAFDELPRRVRNKHLRIALNAGGGIVRDRAKSIVRRHTGLLSKSLGIRVKIPDASFNVAHHGKPAYAVIGAKRGVVAPVARIRGVIKALTIRKATKRVVQQRLSVQTRRPSRYSHLVAKGFRTRGGRRVAGDNFIENAVSQTKSQVIAKVSEKLAFGIETEARALGGRAPALR